MPGRNPRQWSFRGPIAILAAALAVSLTMPTQAQMGRIPANDRDMVYDHFRDVLYIQRDHILPTSSGPATFPAPLSPQVRAPTLMEIESPRTTSGCWWRPGATIQQSHGTTLSTGHRRHHTACDRNGDREHGTYSVAFAATTARVLSHEHLGARAGRGLREYDPATRPWSPVPPDRGGPFDPAPRRLASGCDKSRCSPANAYPAMLTAYCDSKRSRRPYCYYDVARGPSISIRRAEGRRGLCATRVRITPPESRSPSPCTTG